MYLRPKYYKLNNNNKILAYNGIRELAPVKETLQYLLPQTFSQGPHKPFTMVNKSLNKKMVWI